MKSAEAHKPRYPEFFAVRAKLALQGISLAQWCQDRGITRQWAVAVLKGERRGPAAEKLKKQILRELEIGHG